MTKRQERPRIDCSSPIIVRREYGPDTDIKTILRRHGGLPQPTRQPVYTETDYDKDLTTALEQLKRAHAAFEALPQKHRDKFKTADELWNRYRTDNLRQDKASESPAAEPANSSTASGTPTPAPASTPPAAVTVPPQESSSKKT